VRLTITGPPRTKKTSQRIFVNRRTGKPFITSSGIATDWASGAIVQLRRQAADLPRSDYVTKVKGRKVTKNAVWVKPVRVTALFYRDGERGDLCGYMQAVGDALEAAGIVSNDKIIGSWDGSLRLIDRKNPRVELELMALPDP
jgi:Holliday junction resolvase RusA-like endonuclease